MRRALFLTLTLLLLSSVPLLAAEQTDQQQHPSCGFCGMDRVKFAQSRMLIEYADGSSVGTCSLHCAALELALSIDKTPQRILVGDFHSRQLIDAETAVWVIGGDQPGVMSARAKWAFAERHGAEEFVGNHGGEILDFERVMEAAYTDMYRDTKRIRNMRQMKKQGMSHEQSRSGEQTHERKHEHKQ